MKTNENNPAFDNNELDIFKELTYIGEISLVPDYEEIGRMCNEILKSDDD